MALSGLRGPTQRTPLLPAPHLRPFLRRLCGALGLARVPAATPAFSVSLTCGAQGHMPSLPRWNWGEGAGRERGTGASFYDWCLFWGPLRAYTV